MNTEQERADFEAWANGRCELHLVNPAGRYSSATTQFAWEAYQAGRAALQSQTVIDDDRLSIVLDVYDNAMQKAFDGREFQNPCKPGTPEHKAWEKGSKEGKKKRDAGLPNSIALQSQASWQSAADEIAGLRAHVALLKSALAQSERENDELRRAQPAAATAAPSDDEIEALAIKHIAPHHGKLVQAPYQRTEQFKRIKALILEVTARYGQAPAAHGDALDAARWRWVRRHWGRIVESYDGDSDRVDSVEVSTHPCDGWDTDPDSLDAAIDAARAAGGEQRTSDGGAE